MDNHRQAFYKMDNTLQTVRGKYHRHHPHYPHLAQGYQYPSAIVLPHAIV